MKTFLAMVVALSGAACAGSSSARPVATPRHVQPAATRLTFEDLLPGPNQSPSPKILAASGKPVRLRGYIAQMELPPRNGFFLARLPVTCDEAGGGTADLPPDAVFVTVASNAGVAVPAIRGLVEIVGVLDLGYRTESDGYVSNVRVLLPSASAVQGSKAPDTQPSGG